ncbi:MAG: dynamin family protein [Candidatus Promineifilaceae bacterium]|nr:dynamin family protein [Candidatus Promineifilaceae bacterium]
MTLARQEEKYHDLKASLHQLPFISAGQVEQWVALQQTIDATRDYLIRAVPQAQHNLTEAEKILDQRTYTLIFFGGTGVGKSTLINALLGRNLLPTGAVTAVTGTIVYIEQAEEDEPESLTLYYWSEGDFANRVRRLCQLADIESFDITNEGEREQARERVNDILEEGREQAKTERDEYVEIVLDCINSYEAHHDLFADGPPEPRVLPLEEADSLRHLREDGFKGRPGERQIRLVRSATFRIHPRAGQPNLLMDGHLRIVDVPGLGAGMKLHEAITLEEMKREDAMIVLVTDAGRQRVDEMKSLSAVNWIKENRLRGLSGADLDEAASKIFLVVNGANVRQAFDRLNAGLPESELEVREVTRYIAPNYWERYRDRGDNRPYFLVMAPPALYVEDPEQAPPEFESETERILKLFGDQLSSVPKDDPLHPETRAALLSLSEIPLLRESLIEFIRTERVRGQLREATTRVRNALQSLRFYYEKQLAARGVHPPFNTSWESLQERRYENLLTRQQKELPRAFHNALLALSQRTNDDERFRALLNPTLNGVRDMVQDRIEREIENLLESYGTEYWDERDVTYDNLIWGTSGIEVPIKRILYQVELVMQEAVSDFMPEVADVIAAELEQTLEAHDLLRRLERASYGQDYSYTLPDKPAETMSLAEAYHSLAQRVHENFRHICRQATMYELVRPDRSIHSRLESTEEELALPDNDRMLDAILEGPEVVRRLWQQPEAAEGVQRNGGQRAEAEGAAEREDEAEFTINILDEPVAPPAGETAPGVEITFPGERSSKGAPVAELEASYADKLDNIAAKTNRIFDEIIADLFGDDDLLPRLRRLFWLEATRAERDFNNYIVKPMLRQHDRKLYDEDLRQAMQPDLESVSDVEELMRVWEGLDRLEERVSRS